MRSWSVTHKIKDMGKQTLNSSERLYGNETAVVDNAIRCDSACCSWKVSPGSLLLYHNSGCGWCSPHQLYQSFRKHTSSNSVILVAEQRISISADINGLVEQRHWQYKKKTTSINGVFCSSSSSLLIFKSSSFQRTNSMWKRFIIHLFWDRKKKLLNKQSTSILISQGLPGMAFMSQAG